MIWSTLYSPAVWKCHVTNNQLPDKFDNGWKKFKMADLLRFLAFHINNLTLKKFSCILLKFVMHVTNKSCLDKFNNGWKKFKWLIYCDFWHFISIIWPWGRDKFNFNNGDELLSSALLFHSFSSGIDFGCPWNPSIGCQSATYDSFCQIGELENLAR